SIILAVFLTGIGIGSACGAALARRVRRPGLALGICQALLVIAVPYSACMMIFIIPFWLSGRAPLQTLEMRMSSDLLRAAVALLPATFLWGASFPLAVAAAAGRVQDTGRLVGRVYASNTVGAILGSLLGGFVGIPVLGSQGAQQGLILLAALSALL